MSLSIQLTLSIKLINWGPFTLSEMVITVMISRSLKDTRGFFRGFMKRLKDTYGALIGHKLHCSLIRIFVLSIPMAMKERKKLCTDIINNILLLQIIMQ